IRVHESPLGRGRRRDRGMAPHGSSARAAGLTSPPARVGRDGALSLRFDRRDGRSVLAGCRWTMPLQVLAPLALDDAASIVCMLNPTGGLVGGDRLAIDVGVGAGAHACLTTPSATKVYRTVAGPAEQTVRLTLAPGARLEWVPDHAIPFAGSAFQQRVEAEVPAGAALLLIDAFADDVAALGGDDAEVGAGLLPRRGALVRCLAADAPALGRVLEGVWAAARRRVLGLAPLRLRKP